VNGCPVCIDTKDCVICGEDVKLGVIGVSNLVVVASKEGVLVCNLKRDQDTRQIARMFEDEDGEDQYLQKE
jgi:mannose-1-phosphate guanylyltransferase